MVVPLYKCFPILQKLNSVIRADNKIYVKDLVDLTDSGSYLTGDMTELIVDFDSELQNDGEFRLLRCTIETDNAFSFKPITYSAKVFPVNRRLKKVE